VAAAAKSAAFSGPGTSTDDAAGGAARACLLPCAHRASLGFAWLRFASLGDARTHARTHGMGRRTRVALGRLGWVAAHVFALALAARGLHGQDAPTASDGVDLSQAYTLDVVIKLTDITKATDVKVDGDGGSQPPAPPEGAFDASTELSYPIALAVGEVDGTKTGVIKLDLLSLKQKFEEIQQQSGMPIAPPEFPGVDTTGGLPDSITFQIACPSSGEASMNVFLADKGCSPLVNNASSAVPEQAFFMSLICDAASPAVAMKERCSSWSEEGTTQVGSDCIQSEAAEMQPPGPADVKILSKESTAKIQENPDNADVPASFQQTTTTTLAFNLDFSQMMGGPPGMTDMMSDVSQVVTEGTFIEGTDMPAGNLPPTEGNGGRRLQQSAPKLTVTLKNELDLDMELSNLAQLSPEDAKKEIAICG